MDSLWGNTHSQTFGFVHLTAGEPYWFRFTSAGEWWSQAPSAGGRLRVTMTHYTTEGQQNPENDDLYLPVSGFLTLWRDGKLVDITDWWKGYITFTGFAIDFSRRPMTTEQGDINTGERLYMAFHYFNELAVCDVSNWNKRINSMYDVMQRPPGVSKYNEHACSLTIDTSGRILVGWFGKGYLWASDQWDGSPPVSVYLDRPADYHPLISGQQAYVRRIDAVTGCDYPSWDTPPDYENPAFAETIQVPYDKTGSNYIVTSLDGNTLYYTSSGFYVPVGSETVHRWDLVNNIPMSPLITLPARGPNPGVRGMCILPDGGLLVCNGNSVDRVSAIGTLVQTYTPHAETFPHQRQMLIDVHLTTDWKRFWVLDNSTNDLIEFALSGAQIRIVQTGLMGRALTQFAIYAEPPGLQPPPRLVRPVPPSGKIHYYGYAHKQAESGPLGLAPWSRLDIRVNESPEAQLLGVKAEEYATVGQSVRGRPRWVLQYLCGAGPDRPSVRGRRCAPVYALGCVGA